MRKLPSKKQPRDTVVCTEVVQIPLLPEVVKQVLSEKVDLNFVCEFHEKLALEGYTILTQYDTSREQFSVRLAGVTAGLPNEGKMLYGNGATYEKALMSVYAKHFLVSSGSTWASLQSSSSDMS